MRLISNFKYCRVPGPVRHPTEPPDNPNAVPQASEKSRYIKSPHNMNRARRTAKKIMKCAREARPKLTFLVTFLEEKNDILGRATGPRLSTVPQVICQVCQVEDPALQRATDPDFFSGPGKRRNVRIFSKMSKLLRPES